MIINGAMNFVNLYYGKGGISEVEEKRQTIVNKTVKSGISFGSALAMVISYTTWHSVGWAIFHGLLS